ncbi:hypothetical protein RhiXN_05086 [Rhizoctonia solani]|uniref:Uncharacterized protein n=1 Tax=Rhizoctonia solani TaxID=456999 RepID=A0A8H8STH3_9AGAM|nr:uncharacterized protein RhiXN_05086 [Rhizoctonia solani]QRW17084.1 hypothetical protein RhiXN_05086 [Rhizoctonia solani]
MNANGPIGDDLQQLDLQFDCCSNDYYPENECCVPLPVTDPSGLTSNINVDQFTAQQIGLPALFKAHHDSLPLPPLRHPARASVLHPLPNYLPPITSPTQCRHPRQPRLPVSGATAAGASPLSENSSDTSTLHT